MSLEGSKARHLSASRLFVVLMVSSALVLSACEAIGQDGDGDGNGDGASPGASDGAGNGQTQQLTIATGGTGGVYYPLGGGIAEVLRANVEGVDAIAQETNASVDNMLLIGQGDAELALVLGDTAADAVNGEGEFDEAISACTLGRLYNNSTQVITSADSGITSIEDLRGQTVSLGSPGSGTEVIALRVLEAAGIDPDADIEPRGLGVSESVDAQRDGSIDAFFWSGGLPTGAVLDLATTADIRLLSTTEVLPEMQEQYGDVYQSAIIPADTYTGMEGDVETIGVPNYLVVNESMDEEQAYEITKLLFEQKDALVEVHPEAKNLDLQTAQQVEPLELHPGAQRYYDEAG